MGIDTNTAVVLVAFIGIIVPIFTTSIKFLQDGRIARENMRRGDLAAEKVEEARRALQIRDGVLDTEVRTIHRLVNSQLTQALAKIEAYARLNLELITLLKEVIPEDPRFIKLLVTLNDLSIPKGTL